MATDELNYKVQLITISVPPVNFPVPHERWYSQFDSSCCESVTNISNTKAHNIFCLEFDLFTCGLGNKWSSSESWKALQIVSQEWNV